MCKDVNICELCGCPGSAACAPCQEEQHRLDKARFDAQEDLKDAIIEREGESD